MGSAEFCQKDVKLFDIVIAMAASSNSAINNSNYSPTADFELFLKAVDFVRENNIPIKAGNVLSSDEFYEDDSCKKWTDFGVLCVEMETAGIYTVAAKYKVKTLTILTISGSLVTQEKTSAKERENTFLTMVEIALSIL